MKKLTTFTLIALLLAPLTAPHGTEMPAARPIDREALDKWSAPYRGWHYQPDHVIWTSKTRLAHHDQAALTAADRDFKFSHPR